ncbi:MAG: SusC/RagA family TonB-linked outer membrane protein, partial [Bacteroidetes bacterium]|nr:SusC/RagA family TonB-linked outer membrane protein [Bacteroidota bacterium]
IGSYVGYKQFVANITVRSSDMVFDITMAPDFLGLDEVVVTGVASGTPRKKLAFTVGKVDQEQLEMVPATDAAGSLQGKVAGVRVVNAGGTPGSAPSIRLRGSTSLTGSQAPLIIVDGVILEGTLADVNSDDIATIEVVKGASAASLYGSRAANGVVQIITKRGKTLASGSTLITVRNEYGRSSIQKPIDLAEAHFYAKNETELKAVDAALSVGSGADQYSLDPTGSYLVNNTDFGRVAKLDGIVDNKYGVINNLQEQVFDPGDFMVNYVSVQRNSGKSNLSLSFSNTNQSGVVNGSSGFNRQNVRLNFDQELMKGLDFSVSTMYGQSKNDVLPEGPGSPFWGALFLQPNTDLYGTNPDGSKYKINADPYIIEDNPLYQINNQERKRTRTRILGGAVLRYRPLDGVLLEAQYNFDKENNLFSNYTPKGYLSNDGFNDPVPGVGSLQRSTYTNISSNAQLTAGYDKRFDELTIRAKASYWYEASDYSSFSATGNNLGVGGVNTFNALTSTGNKVLSDFSSNVISENIFFTAMMDYKDRYIIDFLIRRDGSSLFGEDNRYTNYYRVSSAYRLSEDIKIDGINEIKLRASIGTAGLRPGFTAQYETYDLSGGAAFKNTLGNALLKPALATETEYGLNIEFLDRFSGEFAYAVTSVKDQILAVPLSAAAGGFSAQWQNAGTLETSTLEASLTAQVVNSKDFTWNLTFNIDKSTQEVTQLNVPAFFTGPSTQSAGIFFVEAGKKFGVAQGNKFMKSTGDLVTDAAGLVTNVPGHEDKTVADFEVNSEGYLILKGTQGTADESPFRYIDAEGNQVFEIMDINPDFNYAFSSTMNFKGFMLYVLFDGQQGGQIYNQSRQWLYRELRHADMDQSGKAAADKKAANYYTAFYNTNNASEYFVEDGSYLKLRELNISYRASGKVLSSIGLGNVFQSIRVGLVGRNLFTWTNYSGYDPEVAGIDGDATNFKIDGYGYPNFRTFSGTIEFTF